MSLKRKKAENEAEDGPDESGMSDAQLSVSSFLRQQRQQALDTLFRLEPQQKQLELSLEKEIENLKRENQRLRSENQTLHSQINSSRSESGKPNKLGVPPSGAPVTNTEILSNSPSQQFEQIAKHVQHIDISGITAREIGILCQVLHGQSSRDNLERFFATVCLLSRNISPLPQDNQQWYYGGAPLTKFNC